MNTVQCHLHGCFVALISTFLCKRIMDRQFYNFSQNILDHHIKIHAMKKFYKCSKCDNILSQKDLPTNLRKHINENQSDAVNVRSLLRRLALLSFSIRRAHTVKGTYQYMKSYNSFLQKSNFTTHMMMCTYWGDHTNAVIVRIPSHRIVLSNCAYERTYERKTIPLLPVWEDFFLNRQSYSSYENAQWLKPI